MYCVVWFVVSLEILVAITSEMYDMVVEGERRENELGDEYHMEMICSGVPLPLNPSYPCTFIHLIWNRKVRTQCLNTFSSMLSFEWKLFFKTLVLTAITSPLSYSFYFSLFLSPPVAVSLSNKKNIGVKKILFLEFLLYNLILKCRK